MGKVNVDIGGRTYPLSCRDGDEEHLAALAGDIADKADGLARTLGAMTESRLLLMAALMVADELYELRRGTPAGTPAAVPAEPSAADLAQAARLAAVLDRAEQLAARLAH